MAVISRFMRVESSGVSSDDIKHGLHLINLITGSELVSVNTFTLEDKVITDFYYRAEETRPLTVDELRKAAGEFSDELQETSDRAEYPLSDWEFFLQERLYALNAHTDKMLAIKNTVKNVGAERGVYFDFENKKIRDVNF